MSKSPIRCFVLMMDAGIVTVFLRLTINITQMMSVRKFNTLNRIVRCRLHRKGTQSNGSRFGDVEFVVFFSCLTLDSTLDVGRGQISMVDGARTSIVAAGVGVGTVFVSKC